MEGIIYRKAKADDRAELQKLYGQFVEQPGRYLNADQDSFLKVLQDKNAGLIVAEKDGSLIGFIMFSLRNVFRYPAAIVEVEEIYVSQQFRLCGVGKAMMSLVYDWAKEHNACYIFLASDVTRADAHSFYKALSYDRYAYHYRLKL